MRAHIFREYDIRGLAETELDDALASAIGRAFAATLSEELGRPPSIALCRDGRLSSPRIHAAISAALVKAGASVTDLGIGPTPLLYFGAHHLHTDGAMQITGSHNPGPDNGVKMMRGTGSFFGADITKLRDRIASHSSGAEVPPGSTRSVDLSNEYRAAVRKASRLPASCNQLRIVVDAGHGAAGPLGVQTLRGLGFQIDPMYCEIDGRFPAHHPDPTVLENLADLRERVLQSQAHLGIAWDGDGDRIGVIDERGDVIWGDKLMILFARGVLREHPGATILGEVKCSQTLFDDVTKHGGRALYSKTGHSLIKTRMKSEGALLAGEMSGHIFFGDRYFGYDDGIYAAVRVLEIVAAAQAEGHTLSSLLADVPKTFATPELRVACPDDTKFEVVKRVTERFRSTHSVLDLDGARIDFGGGAWGLCRASNTQPVLVLRFEAASPERVAEIEQLVRAAVEDARA